MSMSAATEQIIFNEMMGVRKSGKHSPHESNYDELFGTPERTARTLVYVLGCKDSRPWVSCGSCPILDGCVVRNDGYDAMLEWLRGDAE